MHDVTVTERMHTPGPWAVVSVEQLGLDQEDAGVLGIIVATNSGAIIADVWPPTDIPGDPPRSEQIANARLIALSPKLLEACRQFTAAAHEARDILNGHGFACPASIALAAENARNLVAKAEGRS